MKTCSALTLALCCLIVLSAASPAAETVSLTLAEALDQPDRTFTTGGNASWFPQTGDSQDGQDAARSGNIDHSQQSWVETVVAGPGTISFWWKVSSEEDFDFLEFYVDETRQDRISGTQTWTQETYTLEEGAHTVRWRYTKDSSVDDYQDCGWLDQISFAPDDTVTISPQDPWEIVSFYSIPVSAQQVYTLLNEGAEPSNVTAATAATWLDLAESSVSLAAGASFDLAVMTNAQADTLAAGTYATQVIFNNLATGVEHVREVRLTILPAPGQVEVTDSIAPGDDHQLPFGEISVGTALTETIRIRNTHPENNLLVERILLRPIPSSGPPSPSEGEPPPSEEPMLSGSWSMEEEKSLFSTGTATGRSGKRPPPGPDWTREHQPDTILVRFKKTARPSDRAAAHHAAGGRVTRAMKRIPLEVIQVPENASPRALVEAYQKNPHVKYAEPNYLVSLNNAPNDPRFGQLWALENSGQTGGSPGADIAALDAWTWTHGSAEVVVAVIDTGIDYTHPDLAANVWTNPNPTFGDVHGATWTNGDGSVTSGDPMDDNGHGTHVSGTIGAVGNNGVGVTGINWNVRLMGLKFLTAQGFGSTSDAIAAIEYAIDHGAHLTNNSWGGGGHSQALKDMIQAAGEANQLFIAAAGNDASDNDTTPSYPASYDLDNIISVASSDHSDTRSLFSNYGATTVHLAAPGSSILSTIPGGGYDTFSGTSMATPHVAGVAGLIFSIDPSATCTTVKEAILKGVTPLSEWEGVVISGGRLSAAGALANIVKEFRLLNVPALPLNLSPGRSLLLEVVYEPLEAGSHTALAIIETQNLDNPSVEVLLSGAGATDAMEILEEDPFTAEGYFAGPFAPNSKTYTVRNAGAAPLSWSAAASVPWVTIGTIAGTLAPGEQAAVEVALNDASESLPPLLHPGFVTFTNTASGLAVQREVRLRVLPWPGTLAVTDSVVPEEDRTLPFGWTEPGNEIAEAVTLHNTHDTNELIIEDILLLGGYREDFDKPYLLGWDPRPGNSWQLATGNTYRASMPAGRTGFMQSTYLEESWYDGAFEMRLWRQGNVDTAAVLILRASADFDIQNNVGSAILIGINGDGFYYVARFLDGNFHWIQPWTESSALNTALTANVVTANIRNDRLHVFANDSLLWSGTAGGIFRPGRFGLAAFTSMEESTTHHFTHVHVREPFQEDTLPLTVAQSWQNAHPASADEKPSILRSRPSVPALPADKRTETELFDYASLLNRTETFRMVDLPPMPLVIAPGENAPIPVLFSPSGEGNFTRTFRIHSNDPDLPELDVALSGSSELDPLRLFSLASVAAQGQVGGPFQPTSAIIGLFNSDSQEISWQIAKQPPWMTASASSGTLTDNASVEIAFSMNGAADGLPRGRHDSVIEILNTATGFVRAIPVTLEVRPTLCESLNSCHLVWTTGGSASWFGQESVTRRSDAAAQSGVIGDDRESWMQTVVTGPARVSFWWMVSSEQGYDFLEFYVNGEIKTGISGETAWEQKTYKLPEGAHTLRWRYAKDFVWVEGRDTAWLDEVVWTPTAPERVLVVDSRLSFGVVPLGDSSSRALMIENAGDSTLTIDAVSFPAGFSGNWTSAAIAPGASRELVVTFTPANSGHHGGLLEIHSNATSGPATVELAGSSPLPGESIELTNGQVVSGLAGSPGDQLHFFIDAPEHREWMEIRIFGGTGDADLYVRNGAPTTLDQWDFAPYLVGNKESVFINQPPGGRWHFMVHGFEAFADVSISAAFPELSFDSWAAAIDLPSGSRGMLDRHGPLRITAMQGYAFGRDPRLLTEAHLPRIERPAENPNLVRLTYQVRADANDVSVTIESSPDLAVWNVASPVSETTVSTSGGVEVREALFEADEQDALFIRATVTHE